MAVFLNNEMVESDSVKLAKAKNDVVALLKENGYTEEKHFLVTGSIPTTIEEAKGDHTSAGINYLLGGLERWPLRSTLEKQPFRFPVIGSFEITGKGTLVIGYVEQGKIVTGQRLDVVGHGSDAQVVVEGTYDIPGVDELTGLWISNSEGAFIKAGHVLSAPGTLDAKQAFKSYIYFLSPKEGGPPSLFSPIPAIGFGKPRGVFQFGGTMSFYFRASDVHILGEMSVTFSQDISTAQFNLDTPIPLHRGQRFRILGDDRQIIGSGIVTNIIE